MPSRFFLLKLRHGWYLFFQIVCINRNSMRSISSYWQFLVLDCWSFWLTNPVGVKLNIVAVFWLDPKPERCFFPLLMFTVAKLTSHTRPPLHVVCYSTKWHRVLPPVSHSEVMNWTNEETCHNFCWCCEAWLKTIKKTHLLWQAGKWKVRDWCQNHNHFTLTKSWKFKILL